MDVLFGKRPSQKAVYFGCVGTTAIGLAAGSFVVGLAVGDFVVGLAVLGLPVGARVEGLAVVGLAEVGLFDGFRVGNGIGVVSFFISSRRRN